MGERELSPQVSEAPRQGDAGLHLGTGPGATGLGGGRGPEVSLLELKRGLALRAPLLRACSYLDITWGFHPPFFLLRLRRWPSPECSEGWLRTVGPESQQFWGQPASWGGREGGQQGWGLRYEEHNKQGIWVQLPPTHTHASSHHSLQ